MSAEATLKDFGFPDDDIRKALAKFGANVDVQRAVDYILEGCPEDTNAASIGPYSEIPPLLPAIPSYDHAVQSEHETAAAQSLAALQNQKVNNMSAEEQWRGFVPTTGQSSRFSDDGDDKDQAARGRAGRPSPVDEGSAGMPIDLTTQSATGTPGTSVPPLIGIDDNEDEIAQAIRLSLEDQSQMAGYASNTASAGGMSRAASQQGTGTSVTAGPGGGAMVPVNTSKTKEEQEEEDMRKALDASMVDMTSSGMLASETVPEDPKTLVRPSADTPVILLAPSALTSHIPALLHVLYANLPFRQAVLQFQFPYDDTNMSLLYTDFHLEATSHLTRNLLPANSADCLVRMAALQRLFVYMNSTRRSRGYITDFMNAFAREGSMGIMSSPLDDLRELHNSVCNAFLDYAVGHHEQYGMDYERLRQIIFTHALPMESFGKTAIAAYETDAMDPYHPDNEKQLKVDWVAGTDLTYYPPETNDTYSALDSVLASESSRGFILTPSQSLALFTRKVTNPTTNASTTGNTYGPPPGPPAYSTWDPVSSDRLFKVAPELRLDRYVWQNRHRISELREKHDALRKQLTNLKRRQASLATHAKTGRSILGKEEDGKAVKGLLSTILERLEVLAEGVQEEQRKDAQVRLAKKLEQIAQAIKDEAEALAQRIAQLSADGATTWERDLPVNDTLLYELHSLLIWKGLPGRESCHSYVRSGRTEIELGDMRISHDKWWRVGETSVIEVSQSEVLNDTTGMLIQGAGALLHGYVAKQAATEAVQKMEIQPLIAKAIEESNEKFAQELPAEYRQSGASEGVSAGNDADADAGMAMATDSVPAAQTSTTTSPKTTSLFLRGGSSDSRRRSSISSDTGSIASTSRVRIGDDEDALSDGDADEANGETVELGFAEKMTKKGFKVVKDVGKIGGRPTWLNPALPLKKEMIQCAACQAQMNFLLQINAPKDDLPQACYRTLYVYTCSKASCLSKKAVGSTRVFRTQLPSNNPYYEVEEPASQSVLQRFKDKQYSSFCADCKMKHDGTCTSIVWKEWVIDTGPEELDEDDLEPEDVAKVMSSATLSNEDTSADANEPDTKSSVDAAFLRFQDRLDSNPDQILRYYPSDVAKKADPLWVSDDGKPGAGDISNCVCGSSRSCEFQILSTILSYIGVDDLDKDALDFGTIAVFTCDASCSTSPPATADNPPLQEDSFKHLTPEQGWVEEVGFVQNYSSRGLEFR